MEKKLKKITVDIGEVPFRVLCQYLSCGILDERYWVGIKAMRLGELLLLHPELLSECNILSKILTSEMDQDPGVRSVQLHSAWIRV